MEEIRLKIELIQAMYLRAETNAKSLLLEAGLSLHSDCRCMVIEPLVVPANRLRAAMTDIVMNGRRIYAAAEVGGKICYAYINSYDIARQMYNISVQYTDNSYIKQDHPGPFYITR